MDWNFTSRIYNAYNIWKTGLVTTRSEIIREPVCTRSVQIVLDWSWNKCLYINKIVLVCMHLLQHDHSSFDVSLVAFGRQMQFGLKGWFQGFCPLGQLGTKTHLNTSYHSGFFLAKKPPFAQPRNYLNFGTIAKGNQFNEIEKREVPWLPICSVCLFVLVFERESRVWVTWLHMQFLFPGCPLNVALFLHSFHVFSVGGQILCWCIFKQFVCVAWSSYGHSVLD